DVLTGGLGADTLIGGSGNDTADYSTSTAGVTVSLGAGPREGDTFVSIENLAGSGHNDLLSGNGQDNVITGQGGNDRLAGGAGDDVLNGDFADNSPPPTGPTMGSGYATLGTDATNNSFATAFDVTDNFSLASDPDIFDSTTVMHTTVDATGNGQGGYYKVQLVAGSTITIDIDHIADPDVMDSWIRLYDADGNEVAANDDGGGDPGSTSSRDSSISFVVPESGTYYILQGIWDPNGAGDGWSPTVPDGVTYEMNISVEPSPVLPPPGVAGLDVLNGGVGDDLLDGGAKADTLTGGVGHDIFRFTTALGADNIDTITDFNVADDTIQLDNAVMSALGAAGALGIAAFFKSSAGVAHDASDRIIYDTDSGALWYDADGSGAGAAIQIAKLQVGLNLTANDFVII
ncbi:calcium-binding protein, partial [Escherichia coli]|nr:calcium-binding protein [Escherichia coli]